MNGIDYGPQVLHLRSTCGSTTGDWISARHSCRQEMGFPCTGNSIGVRRERNGRPTHVVLLHDTKTPVRAAILERLNLHPAAEDLFPCVLSANA